MHLNHLEVLLHYRWLDLSPRVSNSRAGPIICMSIHLRGLVALLALERVGAAIQGQDQEIDRETQKNDRNAVIADQTVRDCEDHFKHQLQRPDEQLIERRTKAQ